MSASGETAEFESSISDGEEKDDTADDGSVGISDDCRECAESAIGLESPKRK